MIPIRVLICFSLVAASMVPAIAQPAQNNTPPEASVNQDQFWTATFSGGEYNVALNRISSVSRHKYLLDGALVVDEVTIDTVGQTLARFYFIQPVTSSSSTGVGQVAEQAADRTQQAVDAAGNRLGTDVQNMVVKKYPETTHARTVEYRVLSETQLTTLFNSAKKAWQSGKGTKLTVK